MEALLIAVGEAGSWESKPGRELLKVHAPLIAASVAARWSRTVGANLTGALLAPIWEAWCGLIASGRFENAVAIGRKAAGRWASRAAAQAQTGVGSNLSRDLVAKVRDGQLRGKAELPATLTASQTAEPTPPDALPRWAVVVSALLAREGWSWPRPALLCVEDVLSTVSKTGRRRRSPMARHATGVPAQTWGALELLIFGGGPGSLAFRRAPSAGVVWALYGDAGLRSDPEILRVIRSAVAGRPTRAGRSWLAASA